MKVGDLVKFQHCGEEGMLGIITIVCEKSSVSKWNDKLALYWVMCDDAIKCFTGNQLVLL